MNKELRILITLMGDYEGNSTVRTKHAFFFDAISRRYNLVDVFNAGLRGMDRFANAISVMKRDRFQWRERFYKNPAAFRKRSELAAQYLRTHKQEIDLVLQIGALFDSTAWDTHIPILIYSDYTSVLSSRRPEGGRSPFTPEERIQWIRCEASALQRAAHICARSHLVRDSLIVDYSLPPERITVVGGGLNFNRLPNIVGRNPERNPNLLFIGKDFHRKGGDLLLKAFEIVLQKKPETRLTILTRENPSGTQHPNIEWKNGECTREQMTDLYKNSTVLILPSRLETWGDVLLEAMAHGVPCVGIRGQAMEEIIDEGETGFLIEHGNIRQLAEKILLLVSNKELSESFGKAARAKVEKQFLWDHVVDRFAPAIRQAAQQNAMAAVGWNLIH